MSTESILQKTLEAIFGTEEMNNQNQRLLKENKLNQNMTDWWNTKYN